MTSLLSLHRISRKFRSDGFVFAHHDTSVSHRVTLSVVEGSTQWRGFQGIISQTLTLAFAFFLLLQASHSSAQEISANACLDEVSRSLIVEIERYRAVLFGIEKAEDVPLGSVRRATDGSVWMKVGDSEWRSVTKGYESTTWSDLLVDDMSVEKPPHRGLFEVKQSLTSDILPGVIQSARALQCRTKIVCRAAELSKSKDAPVVFTGTDRTERLKPPGCLPPRADYNAFPSCKIEDPAAPGNTAIPPEALSITAECHAMREALLQREFALLKLAIHYDSATRSVHQLAGMFDLFLADFRFPLLIPISQAVNLIGQLNRIPCFLSQCDE